MGCHPPFVAAGKGAAGLLKRSCSATAWFCRLLVRFLTARGCGAGGDLYGCRPYPRRSGLPNTLCRARWPQASQDTGSPQVVLED